MAKNSYKLNTGAIVSSGILAEASRDELRVLLYIVGKSGENIDPGVISADLALSAARVKSSIALFGEHGIISEDNGAPTVSYEFEERSSRPGELDEECSLDVAREIRDGSLHDLIEDIRAQLNRPSLNAQETKHITSLKTQLSLTNEYILTLAAFLSEKGQLKPKRLADTAARLVDKGIDTVEALEGYIESENSRSSDEYELRRLLGIWGRALSASEKRYLEKWTKEFGYSFGIIGEAYDITSVNLNKVSLRYMDKLLTSWHGAGLTTVNAIRAKMDADRALKRSTPTAKKKTAEVADYTNFNANDALMAALARSYGDDTEEE